VTDDDLLTTKEVAAILRHGKCKIGSHDIIQRSTPPSRTRNPIQGPRADGQRHSGVYATRDAPEDLLPTS
jgi:hypothetical protein